MAQMNAAKKTKASLGNRFSTDNSNPAQTSSAGKAHGFRVLLKKHSPVDADQF
jgi:hypothetical protein